MKKNVYKSDKKMADQGWRAMRDLLDKEMPTEQRRRPFWIFWVFGLLLCLSGLLAWLKWPAEPNLGKPTTPVPVAQLPDQDNSEYADLANKQIESQRNIPNQNNKTAATSAASGSTSKEQKKSNSIVFSKQKNRTKNRAETLKIEKQEAKFLSENNIQNLNTAQKSSHQPEIKTHNPESQPIEKTAHAELPRTIKKLASADIPPPTSTTPPLKSDALLPVPALSNTLPGSPEIDPVKENRQRHWAFGATAGLLSNLSFLYTGTTLGLTAAWQPAKCWGLRSGLFYQFQSLRKEQRTVLQFRADSYVQETGDQRVFDTTAANSVSLDPAAIAAVPVYVAVARLHRLEVPLQVFWQPFNKWRMFGGLNFGMNIFATTGKRSLTNNLVLDVPSGVAASNLNQEVTSQVRGWDLRWNAGVGFMPNRRFAFEIAIQNPLEFLTTSNKEFAPLDIHDLPAATESFGQKVLTARPANAGANSLLQFSTTVFF